MAVKFNVSNTKLNATIELTDISEEDYRDIVTYVSMKLGQKKEGPKMATAATMTANPTQHTVAAPKKTRRYLGAHPEIAEALDEYFTNAKANPNAFTVIAMSSREFLKHFPEFSEYSTRAVGRKLAEHCESAGSIVGKSPNGSPTMVARWFVPVRRSNPMGDAIKKAREENGLTVKELAELIEYAPDIVKKWESGEYTPSCDGLAAMKLVLGSSYFEGLN